MQLGDLDRRIRVEQYTEVIDSMGQRVPVWSLLTNCWAKVIYENGSEVFEGDQKVAERMIKFIVRYSSTYKETLRILYDGCYYDVRSVENIERKQYQALRSLRRDRT